MGEGRHITPADHLEELLARAQNPFDVSDGVLKRLRSAVMFQVELRGWRHRNTPLPALRCSSFRHVFLLADGSSLLLWELCYDGGSGPGACGDELREVYDSEEALDRSERRVHRWMGLAEDEPWDERDTAPEPEGGPAEGEPPAAGPHGAPGAGPATGAGRGGPIRLSFDFLAQATGVGPLGRAWSATGSSDHARRLLRRAENPDRPGEETLRLLEQAEGHEILHVPRPLAGSGERHVWCSVYEHAFLLPGGHEVSLYELEHNLSGTGHLVCEVYLEEAVADQAALRLARARGIDL